MSDVETSCPCKVRNAFTCRSRGTCRAGENEAVVMNRPRLALSLSLPLALLATSLAVAASSGGHLGSAHAGHQPDGSVVTSTGQRLTPAGQQLEFPGRPTAIA